MALQKSKTLPSGVTGNHWDITMGRFSVANGIITVDAVLDLFKDSTPGIAPIGFSHSFQFVLTPQELVGNLPATVFEKIVAFANSDIPNIDGVGTHKGCADLVGAV